MSAEVICIEPTVKSNFGESMFWQKGPDDVCVRREGLQAVKILRDGRKRHTFLFFACISRILEES
ncbi:hypothetical protein AM571_CH00206 [Rhizobium etli 8C-3]|uniref:Uncharacterized protein n=1 Tax=Rhizobium etli 8C-3 TaxID=538025 RepID=A0A1L5NYS2_RHIET|nr:hypothetical protein AM571_CH00206 [Rhizobium etli 8C-3]